MFCRYKFTQLHRSHQHPICYYILCTCHTKPRLLGFLSEGENKPSAHLPVISLQINNSFHKDNSSPVNFVRSSWWGEKRSSPIAVRTGRAGRAGRARQGRPDLSARREGRQSWQAGCCLPWLRTAAHLLALPSSAQPAGEPCWSWGCWSGEWGKGGLWEISATYLETTGFH